MSKPKATKSSTERMVQSLVPKIAIRLLARKIARQLYMNSPYPHGGWSEGPLVDRIEHVLNTVR